MVLHGARALNLVVRFALELAALAALGHSAWVTVGTSAFRPDAADGAPLAFAVAWGLFISPKAPRRLADPLRLVAEGALFALVVAALAAADRPAVAVVFAAAAAGHLALMVRWDQRGL
jgi:hypothetical protein